MPNIAFNGMRVQSLQTGAEYTITKEPKSLTCTYELTNDYGEKVHVLEDHLEQNFEILGYQEVI